MKSPKMLTVMGLGVMLLVSTFLQFSNHSLIEYILCDAK